MTNSIGNGGVAVGAFSGLVDDGIRTLSGGQISIQVEGYLATQTDAAPALVMEDAHAARDIFAVVTRGAFGWTRSAQLADGEHLLRGLDHSRRRACVQYGERVWAAAAGLGRSAGA